MTVRIVGDSSMDFLSVPGVDYKSVPMTISTDERSFVDDENINLAEMLDYLAAYKGRSYSACPGVGEWLAAFEGGKEIFAITLTSGLSGAYNSAMVAKETFEADNPGSRVHVFDTLSAGAEPRLITRKLIDLVRAGTPFDEVVSTMNDYMLHTRLFFSLESLHNFAQNGRVPKIVAQGVEMLGLRITGTVTLDGKLAPGSKVRGDKRTMKKLIELLEEAGYVGGRMCICCVDNFERAKEVAAGFQAHWPSAEIEAYEPRGLVSYYAERNGVLIGVECTKEYK